MLRSAMESVFVEEVEEVEEVLDVAEVLGVVVVFEIVEVSGWVAFTSGVIDVVCDEETRGASTGAIGGDGGGFGVWAGVDSGE